MTSHESKKITIFGYEVGNLTALMAFTISVITWIGVAWDRYVSTPNPIALPIEYIEFRCSSTTKNENGNKICEDNKDVRIIATPVTVLNDTTAPHAFTISRISLEFSVGNDLSDQFTYWWFWFGDALHGNHVQAAPRLIKPNESFTSEITFTPKTRFENGSVSRENFLTWGELENKLIESDGQIYLRLNIFSLTDSPITVGCELRPSPDLIKQLKNGEKWRFTEPCLNT